MFREPLTKVCHEDYTKGGRPPINVIIKFKTIILRRIYNLSFDQIVYQINDCLSFMWFLGLGLCDEVLDTRTIWDEEMSQNLGKQAVSQRLCVDVKRKRRQFPFFGDD